VTTSEQELLTTDKLTSYSFKVENRLYKRLTTHLNLLKNLEDQNLSMQKWMLAAFKEKIDQDKTLEGVELIKERHFHFKVSKELNNKIEDRVNLVRKFKRHFTKKQWFVEAFYEKLDREEIKAKRLLEQAKEPVLK
jgi:hypothetical protein